MARTNPTLERMRQELPAGVLELLDISGLKRPRILKLHTLLGVTSLAELAAACAVTKGLGPALERKIVQDITIARDSEGRLRMNQAEAVLNETKAELERLRLE